jgi:hypothetical protein
MTVPVEVSVVMPCLNEAGSVERCVRVAREALERGGLAGEVVVADNGSTDGSPDLATAAGARVVHAPTRGYGAAYLEGLRAARGRYLVLGDADGTYDFSAIPAFVAKLREGNDVVLGSRLKGTILPGAMPWLHRWIGNPALSLILSLFFGRRISDTQSGLRGLRREAAERMNLRTTGMEFASEMVAMALRHGLKVAEIPIVYAPRTGHSKLRSFRDGWRHLRFMLLLSPTPLFLVPGLAMLVLGVAGLIALLPGPIRAGGLVFDFHFMFAASALALLGLQLIVLGLAAKTSARTELAVAGDRWLAFLDRWFTLERGVVLGLMVAAVGTGIGVTIVWEWLASGRAALFAVRPALVALTTFVLGAQLVFGSFFISVLRHDARG